MPTDPYTSPPLRRDRGGPLMRVLILVALLGVAVWGFMSFAGHDRQALVVEQDQSVAANGYESGYTVTPLPDAPAPADAARSSANPSDPPA